MKTETLALVIMQSAKLTGQTLQRERKDQIEDALGQAHEIASA